MQPIQFAAEDLERLEQLNRLRASKPGEALERLETEFVQRFAADTHFAVYGSLAPGRANHHQLSDLAGVWRDGAFVRGARQQTGWGAQLGFPALRWSEAGEPIPIQLFISPDLPQHWARLDAFEGDEYLRILAPVRTPMGIVAVANVYAARD